jgi:hypothetical protein
VTTTTEPPLSSEQRLTGALGGAFTAMSDERARDPHRLSLSGLGRCTRRAAYQIAGTPVSDVFEPGQHRAANLGTILHDALVPRLAKQLGATYEEEVLLRGGGLELRGTYDIWEAGLGEMTDLKSVGEHRLSTVRRFGAFREHRVQGFAYALAQYQAGLPVKAVNLLYIDRARGDHEVVNLPFTRGHALKVLDRITEIQFHAADPDNAPRDPDGRRKRIGPGWSFECNDCPFLRRCWGPDAKPGNKNLRSQEPADDAEVEAICAALVRAREIKTEAEKDMEWYRIRLGQANPNTYGPYQLTNTPGHEIPDQAAMRARLEQLGEQVPTQTTAGTVGVRVVKKVVAKTAANPKEVTPDAADAGQAS